MYQQENEESIEITLSIGEIIQYDNNNGEIIEGEVIEISEEFSIIQVLPVNQLLRIPEWINVEDILLDEDIEYV